MMKPEIFIAVKAMIAADPSVCGDQLDLVLAVNIRTVDYYIRVGKLPCVKGSGNRVIGIPRESIIEMMTCRGEDPERAIR